MQRQLLGHTVNLSYSYELTGQYKSFSTNLFVYGASGINHSLHIWEVQSMGEYFELETSKW